ncbi:MAG: HEAT repeat domain-containing protein, partial [bacterium]|nr:HEAT repeat domain-containing protein [bacterium]
MLVEKKRLIELLYHEDERVKSAAAEALEKFFPGSDDVIEHLLKVIDTAGEKAMSLAAAIKYFVPTENDLHEVLRYIKETGDKKNTERHNLHMMLKLSFREFPFELLEKNYRELSFDKELVRIYDILKEQKETIRAEP